MVRKGAIVLGVGATVAVGGIGFLAFQLRNNYRAAAAAVGEGAATTVVVEPAAVPVPGDGPAAVAVAPAPTDPVAAVLKGNTALLDEQDRALVAQLLELDQTHLFEGWPEPGTDDVSKRRLLSQLRVLDGSYHGGIAAYVRNARNLLAESRDGVNPFEGYVPSVPRGATLDYASPELLELEAEGLREAGGAAFVLVAGGLGERLGYSGIKVALPSECASGTPFLGLYIASILALQRRAAPPGRRLPLAIMTSDDTHDRTQELLRRNKYFGMEEDQITLLKQEKVACLTDNSAHLALEAADRFCLQTKPHGHGDVHMLLAGSGLAGRWLDSGLKWVCFFQDTNALVFRALLAALGVSSRHDFDMNSLAVPRKAREAIGAIAALTRPDGGGAPLTINVEYNQLDPLLRSTVSKEGDVNDASGYSPFPGNINQLVLKLSSYVPQLAATGGVISEFVNPKYKDATKTDFKSSTRLECMMQDYPKALPPGAKVGFTTIKQVWATYSPVKNSPADAAAKFKEGNPTHSATTGELDIYKANCLSLAAVAAIELPCPLQTATFNGITTEVYPRVVLSPSFAPSLGELRSKVAPGSIRLTPGSVLVLDGPGIRVVGPLVVRGALVVRAVEGAEVALGPLRVDNAGWDWQPLEGEAASEEERIRGFKVVRRETRELIFDKPGSYTVAEAEQQEQEQRSAPAAEEAAAAPAAEETAEAPAVTEAAAEETAEAPAAEEAAPAAPAAEEVAAAPAAEVPEPPSSTEAPAPAEEAASAAPVAESGEAPAAADASSEAAAAETADAAADGDAAAAADDEANGEPEAQPAPAAPSSSSRGGASAAALATASSSGLSPTAKPFVPASSVSSGNGSGGGASAGASAGSSSPPASVTASSSSGMSKNAKKKAKAKAKAAAAANGAKA
ncbi:hypothetical protein PLESTB_000403900 [Pleodorina starrii]|uniref:UTP-monosaccharide-1-phosphate uridylyltransferase n=1 Tax=Pleodorina starrii TaxID=330485 RepID=A0A9W6EZ38_9CHLO|nr:hypothetical protein PLESTB_000403900 [Pleodorina starrii]GLC75267.1 hypothetical protein PLESTF_001615500 [Pleodorina starrii]